MDSLNKQGTVKIPKLEISELQVDKLNGTFFEALTVNPTLDRIAQLEENLESAREEISELRADLDAIRGVLLVG